MKRLGAAGYHVASQWRVGAFRIDLVVEGHGRRLAIECDGDRYHPLEKLPEDMDRQSVLERMGWIFTRIRGTEFFRNPDRAMKPVFEKLQLLEISPNGAASDAPVKKQPSGDLIERIIRRAEELRTKWLASAEPASRRQGDPRDMPQFDPAV
jgi:very-short-patch-repair endonuclease